MRFDVLIVGGGPAGLSAALILGRCHRTVLLCDAGHQRNLRSHAIHGLLGREGRSPAAFLDEARAELTRYRSVSVRDTLVEGITPSAEGFEFVCRDGTAGRAAKVLLASGLVDELPDVAGIQPLYGISVHHCLYCDGFEYAGKPVAAYGKGDKGAELAIMMKHWIFDVVACSDGTEISAKAVGADPIPGRRGRGAEEYPVRGRKSARPFRLVFFDRLPSGVRLIKKSWLQAE